jgi:protein-L-isoaspartate(D-aspartate) O-methyltransferase
MDTELARFNMIEQQIRPWDVLDPAVLELLSTVRREDFVPPAMRGLAFVDMQLPLIPGEPGGPVMLEPKVQARLLQELKVQRHEKVLEIGTGSGYLTALLAHRAMHVHSLECHAALATQARENLRRAGVINTTVHDCTASSGAAGYAAEAPFDAIVLAGSVAEVPRALLEQLKPQGRLAAIVGEEPIMRAMLYTRTGEASWTERALFDTVAPRLQGFVEPTRFRF